MKTKNRNLFPVQGVVCINIFLISVLIIVFSIYKSNYEVSLYNQNLADIYDSNNASSAISSSFFSSAELRLCDLRTYAINHKLPLNELIKFIEDTNRVSKQNIQVITKTNLGYSIVNTNDSLSYRISYQNDSYLYMQDIFESSNPYDVDVHLLTEFTDQVSLIRSIGQYIYIPIYENDSIRETVTVLMVYDSVKFIQMIQPQKSFANSSTILANKEGEYIVRNANFLSNSFYQFLINYNNYSLEDLSALSTKFLRTGSGYFEAFNANKEKCVYTYSKIQGTEWFCINSVPVSSFHTAGLDVKFAFILMFVLLSIMLVNFLWLLSLNMKLRTSMQEAQNASNAKTEFLSRMSHDIRTPMNAILGTTSLALDEIENPTALKKYLQTVSSSGRFLLGLINDILDINKIESGNIEFRPEVCFLEDFLQAVQTNIGPLLKKKDIEFNLNIDKTIAPSVRVDILRFNQIFFNLLSNAAKYTPNGGKVDFIAENLPTDEGFVAVRFRVKDNGIGISSDYMKKLFQPFTRDKTAAINKIEGSGLGLAIVKNIVDAMKGNIQVVSELGKGTEFIVELKMPKAENAARVVNKVIGDESLLLGKRILLVEDNEINISIEKKMLEKKGCLVTVAQNGLESIHAFEKSIQDEYALILMDIRMPVMDGIEATQKIRALNHPSAASIPIIAMTADAFNEDMERTKAAGMNAHIIKPIEPAKLYSTMISFLDNQ